RLTAVVVLPTPPFWLATAMTRFMRQSVLHPATSLWEAGAGPLRARHVAQERADARCNGPTPVAADEHTAQALLRPRHRARLRRCSPAGPLWPMNQERADARCSGRWPAAANRSIAIWSATALVGR